MTQKGKLPETGKMILESTSGNWMDDIRHQPKDFPMTAIILDGEVKKRVKLVLDTVYPPGSFMFVEVAGTESFDHPIFQTTHVNKGMARIYRFLNDCMSEKVWIIFAHIDSAKKNQIMILHFENIDLTLYSQKLTSETMANFLPILPGQEN